MDDVMVVFQLCQGLLNWLLFTIGLMGILRKLKYKRPWYSWFTGLRYFQKIWPALREQEQEYRGRNQGEITVGVSAAARLAETAFHHQQGQRHAKQ